MKIAVLADIHANLAAFETAVADIEAWRPDAVIVAGDIVNRGPEPRACVKLALRLRAERGWHLLRGNHEGYVLHYDRELRAGRPPSGGRRELLAPVSWTHAELGDLLPAVAALPEQLALATPGGAVSVYHASVRHNRDGLLPRHRAAELRPMIDPSAAVFATGHTHLPFTRRVDGTLVVNVGSVGLPFDGDRRAGYARISHGPRGWRAQIVRLGYDHAATLRSARGAMLAAGGPLARIMLREIETAQSLLFDFVPVYNEPVIAGAISLEDAVRRFLADAPASGAGILGRG